jgi:hypothetical protein
MTKPEYLTYVSLYMAGIDTHTTGKELAFIEERFGAETFEKIKQKFDVADEAERVNTIKNAAKPLKINNTTLQTELKYLGGTDGKITSNENYLINFIVKLLD